VKELQQMLRAAFPFHTCCCELPILGDAEEVNDWSAAALLEISVLKASLSLLITALIA
jgi:hypothetical protein